MKDLFFVNAHLNLDYLEIPVLLKFDFTPDANMRPNLFAGPALGLLLASKFHIISETYDLKDYTTSTDFSLVFGGGIDYKRVTFDLRYTLGLSNIVNAADKINVATGAEPGDPYYLEGDPTVKNRNISFMLGVKL